MLDKETSDAYTKMMFGENAIRTRAMLCLQDNGSGNWIAGFVPNIKSNDDTHEFIDCEIIIRPIKRATSNEYRGHGISSAAMEGIQDLLIDKA